MLDVYAYLTVKSCKIGYFNYKFNYGVTIRLVQTHIKLAEVWYVYILK